MLQAALQAGKHVLCEKPTGVSPADAAAMKHAADGAKTVVMFGMQYRNNLKERKIFELLSEGRMGPNDMPAASTQPTIREPRTPSFDTTPPN